MESNGNAEKNIKIDVFGAKLVTALDKMAAPKEMRSGSANVFTLSTVDLQTLEILRNDTEKQKLLETIKTVKPIALRSITQGFEKYVTNIKEKAKNNTSEPLNKHARALEQFLAQNNVPTIAQILEILSAQLKNDDFYDLIQGKKSLGQILGQLSFEEDDDDLQPPPPPPKPPGKEPDENPVSAGKIRQRYQKQSAKEKRPEYSTSNDLKVRREQNINEGAISKLIVEDLQKLNLPTYQDDKNRKNKYSVDTALKNRADIKTIYEETDFKPEAPQTLPNGKIKVPFTVKNKNSNTREPVLDIIGIDTITVHPKAITTSEHHDMNDNVSIAAPSTSDAVRSMRMALANSNTNRDTKFCRVRLIYSGNGQPAQVKDPKDLEYLIDLTIQALVGQAIPTFPTAGDYAAFKNFNNLDISADHKAKAQKLINILRNIPEDKLLCKKNIKVTPEQIEATLKAFDQAFLEGEYKEVAQKKEAIKPPISAATGNVGPETLDARQQQQRRPSIQQPPANNRASTASRNSTIKPPIINTSMTQTGNNATGAPDVNAVKEKIEKLLRNENVQPLSQEEKEAWKNHIENDIERKDLMLHAKAVTKGLVPGKLPPQPKMPRL